MLFFLRSALNCGVHFWLGSPPDVEGRQRSDRSSTSEQRKEKRSVWMIHAGVNANSVTSPLPLCTLGLAVAKEPEKMSQTRTSTALVSVVISQLRRIKYWFISVLYQSEYEFISGFDSIQPGE